MICLPKIETFKDYLHETPVHWHILPTRPPLFHVSNVSLARMAKIAPALASER
jgi:hypothetical protein